MEIGTIKQIDIQNEMQGAYLDYAMSVIVARALPDVRDGLKPVHRRILYAMHDMGLTHDKPYKKSARIVGEVLGKYHPHGDSAVYDAMVRMAQDFSLRYPLVDGQGNFGSIDGDNPAAMRYTEARLAELAREMLGDIGKETVDFTANFDETLQEPLVLPATIPNLLVNGASGIAVGMATNIPPHNLGEVCDALIYLLDRYDQIDEVTVEALMQFIKGPDFPTGGIVYRYDGNGKGDGEDVIARAYASGRGRFRVQARAYIEEMSRNRNRIVITELPYQVNKTRLIERIAELAREEKIEGITDLRDESDRTGMRIIIEMTRNVDPKSVLADLYKYTPMQQTFGMIMLALVDGEPRLLSLRRALVHYVEHRRIIIRRRSEYDLARARERAHILEGLLKALDILDEVIQTIRRSQTTETARANLIRKFKFSEIQAQAILDMPLKRLAALERKRLQDEYDELLQRIAYLEDLLANPYKILGVIRADLVALKERYGDPRRTRIADLGASSGSLTVKDLLDEEPVIISLGADGRLLREKIDGRRRGKLPAKVGEAAPIAIAAGTTHNELFLFSADGRMGRLAIHRLQDGAPAHPADLGLFRRDDRLVALLIASKPERDEDLAGEEYLILATREGRVKRIAMEDVWSAIGVSTVMNVEGGDELVGVAISAGGAEIMLVSKLGQAIRFQEGDVRPMGLPAAGVWGMKLSSGDEVVSLCLTRPEGELVVATTNGYFKRSDLKQFSIQGRYGSGLSAIRLGQRSGAVADAKVALPGDEFFSASRKGTLRRLDLAEIPAGGRSATGKLLVQPAKADFIANLLHLPTERPRARGRPGASGASQPASPSLVEPARAVEKAVARPGVARPRPAARSSPASQAAGSSNAAAGRSQPAQSGAKPAGSRRPTTRAQGLAEDSSSQPKPATRGQGKPAPAKAGRPTPVTAAKGGGKKPAAGKPAKQLSLLDKLRSVDSDEG